jgi:hypothetical protein
MANWIEQYNESSPKTKSFILTWFIYGLALLITTVYCYARLDFVRSYPSQAALDAKTQTPTTNQKP